MLVATDFFTAEVWTASGLVTYYVLFFVHLASRRVHVAGVTPHPDQYWMGQMVRNAPTETFQSWAIPSGGIHAGIVRHMRPTREGNLLIHQSSTNRILLVTLKSPAARR